MLMEWKGQPEQPGPISSPKALYVLYTSPKAIVWRVPRLPKHGQGSYTNHEFVCKLQLTGYDQMPEKFDKNFYVEFTQPACATSHTVLRSVSIQPQPDEPPEKYDLAFIALQSKFLSISYSL